MKKRVKIVTIGGGSSYTPELMEGFIRRYDEMPISEIWLVDIEEGKEKLQIVGELTKRMWKASGYNVEIHLSLDRKEALKDADFVTTQFRVGQLNARIKDERIPLHYGMAGQETNGAGGIFKAFRTIPVMLEIVEEMKELCPDAWLINFTNPSGILTEAVIRYRKWEKIIGLCNAPVGSMMQEPGLIDKNSDDLIFRFGGLNHFHWHKVYDLNGNDMTSLIIEKMSEKIAGLPANIKEEFYLQEQLICMNMIPCAYHQYYYKEEEMLAHMIREYQNPDIGTRAQQVKKTEEELFKLYQDPYLDHKPKQLMKRGGAYYSEAACETICAIYADKKVHMVVSTLNRGAITELPDDCVVEVSSIIDANGASPIAFSPLSYAQKGWLLLMKNMELCICEAAVHGDYGLALEAFIMNPLIFSGENARKILNELLIAHEKDLPQFHEKIMELKTQQIQIQDEIARELT